MTDPKTLVAQAEALEGEANHIRHICLNAPSVNDRDIGQKEYVRRSLKSKHYKECEDRMRTQAHNLRALAAAQPGQGEREAFEAWAEEDGYAVTRSPFPMDHDCYIVAQTYHAWNGWQAARTQPPAQPVEEQAPRAEEREERLARALSAIGHTTNHCDEQYSALSEIAQQIMADIEADVKAIIGHGIGITVQHVPSQVAAMMWTQPPAQPEGWVMVLREPTGEMLLAGGLEISGIDDIDSMPSTDIAEIAFRAMLAAAPQAPGADKGAMELLREARKQVVALKMALGEASATVMQIGAKYCSHPGQPHAFAEELARYDALLNPEKE